MLGSEGLTPLGAEDAQILGLECGPICGHALKVLILREAPGEAVVPALRAAVAQRLPEMRRWRQRLVAAPGTPSGLAWQDDPDFDLERHVRAACVDRPMDDGELRRIVADIMKARLERARPLWTLEVIPRLADGRWAIAWKIHHCLADGMMMMRAGSRLLWTEEPPPQREQPRSRPAPPEAPSKMAAGARLATLAGYRGLLLREFRRVWGLSPLAADVGPDRAIGFAHCTLDELRTLGKAIDPEATINDVLLAVVAGALRRWLEKQQARPARMKVQVPVSMHPHLGEEDPCGNRDSFLFVNLPLHMDDPVDRVRAVSKATRKRKNRHDARAIYALRASLQHAPPRVRRALQRLVQGPHEYSLNVSNVPGPAGPIQVLGHRVDAIYPIAEIAPHHALRVAALSLGRSLWIGLCADPHVVPDLDVLTAGIHLSIDEMRERLRIPTSVAEADQRQ